MIRINNPLWGNLQGLQSSPPANNDPAILLWSNGGQINANVIKHLTSYLTMVPGVDWGPYEIHPYIHRYPTEFNIKRKILLLGTFPPNSYMNNIAALQPFAGNHPHINNIPLVDFYYGNTASLWQFFGLGPLVTVPAILNFLNNQSISISDVALGIQRNLFISPADSALYNILPNFNLCDFLNNSFSLETVLLTSGSLRNLNINPAGHVGMNSPSTTKIFIEIIKHVCRNDIEISGQPDGNGPFHPLTNQGINAAQLQQYSRILPGNNQLDQFRHIVWYIKINSKTTRIINLPTPSGALGMIGSDFFYKWLRYKANINGLPLPPNNGRRDFMLQYPNIFIGPPTNQYRSEIYQMSIFNLPLLITL